MVRYSLITKADMRSFIDRPNGGMEVEMIYGAVEFWWALVITLYPVAILHTTTIEDLFWTVPHYYVAIPWWIAALLTWFGLWLYHEDKPICAWFRWSGAFVSAALWFVMFFRGALIVPDTPWLTLSFYFFGAAWQPRIMYSAHRRYLARLRG